MNRTLVLMVILLFATTINQAQDIITLRSGEDILAVITEISQTEIRYKKFEDKTGPTFMVGKSDVLMIRYENGTKDIFEAEPKPALATPAFTKDEMYLKGQNDALKYYHGYRGAGTGTLFTASLLNMIFGLVPAIACSSTPPKDKNLNCPEPELLKDGYYHQGYVERAHKTKRKKVWTNFWIGSLISTVIILAAE